MIPTRILISALSLSALAFPSTQADRPPNVLFIAIDDLNDWVGVLGGHPQAHTPNIDRLAQRGALFTQAFCAAPICVPSRTSVLTGVPPHVSGVIQNQGLFRPRIEGVVTLPELFRKNGYRSLGAGKVFHYPDPESWDSFYPANERIERDPKPTTSGQDCPPLRWGPLDVDDMEMFDGRVTAWAARQVAAKHDRPFFLACGLTKPHLPWNVPRRYFERFPLGEIELPVVDAHDLDDLPPLARSLALSPVHEKLVAQDKWKAAVRAYLATVAFVDARVGVLLDALAAGPNADDTIVVLWSDHGLHLGEKGHWKKSGLWDDSTRVPLIFAGPMIEPGRRIESAVGLIDLYRTTAELCGLEVPGAVEGYSLLPLLDDPTSSRPAPVLTTIGIEYSVRSDRWRYTLYRDGGEELYDHASDPNEWKNLAGDEELASIKRELAAWIPESK